MRNGYLGILAMALVMGAIGCAGLKRPDPKADATASPSYGMDPFIQPTVAMPSSKMCNEGSLFNPASSSWSPWSDVTAHTIGDIITVRIAINSSAEGTATTDLSRDSNVQAALDSLMGRQTSMPGYGADPKNPGQLFKSSYTSNFKGDGDTRRSGKIEADVSAVVMQVFPNGNMVIHGSQSTLINNENSVLTVDGMVRPKDVSSDNVVLSDRIANAHIQVTGRGALSDKQRPGFFMRMLDWFWMF